VSLPERCVVVGAGRVGCGYVAERLRAAGHQVSVVTHTVEQAAALDRDGGVSVRLLSRSGARDVTVAPLVAMSAEDAPTVARTIAQSSLVAVSVGSRQLYDAARVIAPGLTEHRRKVNVLVFENEPDSGERLQALVAAHEGSAAERHGYAGVLVDRIVTAGPDERGTGVRFIAESRIGAAVDAGPLIGPLPRVAGLRPVSNFRAHMLRKLYVFSTGHAAAAYLGAVHGHRSLVRALDDPEVRAGVLAAMTESQAGLAVRYGHAFAGGPERRLAEFARFRNAALGDTVDRVGRDPFRKLGPADRIVGPALLAESAGIPPTTLAVVAAAALDFAARHQGVAGQLRDDGPAALLERYAGVPAASPFAQLVDRAWTLGLRTRSIGAVRATLAAESGDAVLVGS
jgi:mannitol-1-phosphate 5-dehydrogenase